MGQRLVITTTINGEEIAAIYYHWSGYSTSALQEAKELLETLSKIGFSKSMSKEEQQLAIIRAVEIGGGEVKVGDESERVKAMFPKETFTDEGSRNDGLIAITPEGIQDLKFWGEESLDIDFDNETIYDGVLHRVDENDTESMKEYFYDEDDEEILKDCLSVDNFDPEIKFEDLDSAIELFQKAESADGIFKSNGYYYILIY